ncbi:39S ribosomal protein L38, mitochondrial [Elysia marginata]|uniref:Large ribosomal subunit protein mL38 n=1 Tax=Elysia marginata TaxID=1093978 RepID=A0AAV4I9R9_9GAST|nr:39S ribosomal protein L38, mitochondrial [Elysia marginata]
MAACMSIRRPMLSIVRASKCFIAQPVRYRWKPPDKDAVIFPKFSERLEEWKSAYEPPASYGINIGFHFHQDKKQDANRALDGKSRRDKKKHLEAAARHRKLRIDMDTMREDWNKESMPDHVCRIAEHYGIFHDMFDGAHFHPVVPLEVAFDHSEELFTPVCYGNIIPASETSKEPSIIYNSSEDSLWTLIMASPDGNLEENQKELLHWFIGNIPGSAMDKGEQICKYLQPFPPRGTGFLRYVFVLFKQEGKMDYAKLQRSIGGGSLRERSFSMHQFYKAHQSSLTPAGLAFFQSEWDTSVTSVFHNELDMKEPMFEFIHPPEYLPAQIQFPHKEPFNLYMDMYRDVKDLQEEVLKLKLSTVDPTKPPAPKLKYPNSDALPNEAPSWLRAKIQHQRLGQYQWRDLYEDRD